MVPWKLGFHSAWQQSSLSLSFFYGCIRCCRSKAVGKAWEDCFSSLFTLESSQSLSAPVFCRQRLQRRAIYSSGLHLKGRSLNIDCGRMWVLLSSPFPVSRTAMLIYLYFEKVRLLNYPHIWFVSDCVRVRVCVYTYFLQHGVVQLHYADVQLYCPLLIHCLLCLPNLWCWTNLSRYKQFIWHRIYRNIKHAHFFNF